MNTVVIYEILQTINDTSKQTPCTYRSDHLSDDKVLLSEVSCFCERRVVVVACGLRAVRGVGT